MNLLMLSILLVSCSLFFTVSATADSLLSKVAHGQVIDLSQTLSGDIPTLPLFWPLGFELVNVSDNGVYANTVYYVEHVGTHVDAPSHFLPPGDPVGGNNIDQLSLDQLFLKAIVLDVTAQVEGNDDYELTPADVEDWEEANGEIPDNTFVIVYTSWQERWSDPVAYTNMYDGAMHFPGVSPEAVELLAERNISGLGIDTFSPDNGLRIVDWQPAVHWTLLGSSNKLIIENMTNLDQLPPKGITLILAPLAVEYGSASPARILAVLEDEDEDEDEDD